MLIVALLALGFVSSAFSDVRSLGGRWTVTNSLGTIKLNATVPGGIYSDLLHGGIISGNLFYEKNDVKYRWVGQQDWNYAKHFTLSKTDLQAGMRLVFHGLDTVASIWLNGYNVGVSTNMFVRTIVDIKQFAQVGTNLLEVRFKSPIKAGKQLAKSVGYEVPPTCPSPVYNGECHVNQLRKMQASFSWDWGPAFPSVGIWKNVELELTFANTIRDVGFTTMDLDSDLNNYLVEVAVWFDDLLAEGQLLIILPLENGIAANFSGPIHVQNGKYTTNLSLPKRYTHLWWPRGYGEPKLYNMVVEFRSLGDVQLKNLLVGIRTVNMIQSPVFYGHEKKGLTFYLVVNKVPVFVKGSNWIPMDVLPERGYEEERLAHLLESAIESNFNSLRVWGGGVYESDLFYEYCDRLGILIWQDLMFACAMYPTTEQFLSSVQEEVTQQIKRLQHHPSIFTIGGNNENEAALVQNWYGTSRNQSLYRKDYVILYAKTINQIVESLDRSRPYFTSSPSNGIETVEAGYISDSPQSNLFGDVHFYIYLANMWDPLIYPTPRFASEYGMQSLPSIHTLALAVDDANLTWGSDSLNWRQHSPGGFIYMESQIKMNLPWSNDLATIVYLSQINQAMAMKTETEHYRRYKTILDDANQGRTMGALYWQLNDVWEAPTWSSIDYFGNWKMLQYFARDFMADLLVIPIKKINTLEVYVVSDANILTHPHPVDVTVTTHIYKWHSLGPFESKTAQMTMQPGNSQLLYSAGFDEITNDSKANYFLVFELEGSPTNFVFPMPLKDSNYPDATVEILKAEVTSRTTGVIHLRTNAIALFVWLESPFQNRYTKFSENGFHMLSTYRTVNVSVKGGITQKFLNSITVRNLKKKYNLLNNY